MKIVFLLTLFIPFRGYSQFNNAMTKSIKLGDSTINIVTSIQSSSETLYLNIHEDEQTSIDVAKAFSKKIPINFIFLNHNQTRRIHFNVNRKRYSVDPNRIYTEEGRKKTIKPWWRLFLKDAKTQAEHLSNEILNLISPYKTIVSMHNNTDVNYSIKSYLPKGGEAKNTAQVYISEKWDADDFIYTTERRFYDYLKAKNVNVILQDNEKYVNDGSLSVYCGEKGIPYINIEAQKGHFEEQYKLTEIIHEMLEKI